jgi:hypothetical protein
MMRHLLSETIGFYWLESGNFIFFVFFRQDIMFLCSLKCRPFMILYQSFQLCIPVNQRAKPHSYLSNMYSIVSMITGFMNIRLKTKKPCQGGEVLWNHVTTTPYQQYTVSGLWLVTGTVKIPLEAAYSTVCMCSECFREIKDIGSN